MDKAAAEVFIQHMRHQRLIVDYAFVASFAVLLYDFFLVLHLEVKHIWFSNWNYTKVLYLLTRYIPIANIWSSLSGQALLNLTRSQCEVAYTAETVFLPAGLIVAEAILALRTWAVWKRDLRVGLILLALEITYTVVSIIYSLSFVNSLHVIDRPYDGFRGCLAVQSGRPGTPWESFLVLTIVEIAVLILMAASAFRAYRQGYASELSNIIHRDALQYYFYLMCIVVSNLTLLLTVPVDLASSLLPMQASLHSIFCCRIIINIRVAAEYRWDSSTALHDWCQKEISPANGTSLSLQNRGEGTT